VCVCVCARARANVRECWLSCGFVLAARLGGFVLVSPRWYRIGTIPSLPYAHTH
jgi:hypothetical protein